MVYNYVKRYAELKCNALEVRIKSLTITKLKYKCIRCLCDDLTNDAACVSLDQCLNCSRYEPIEGQVYEIMNDNLKPGEANIYDDVQAAYMSKNDYVVLNRIEEMNTEKEENGTIDLGKTNERDESDKDFKILLAEADNFVMDWQRKPWDYESPHINKYEYDFAKIGLDKENRLNPANKYEDGWREIEQYKYDRPDYGIATLGDGINSNGYVYNNTNTVSLYFKLEDYDIDPNDVRFKIVNYAKEACELCKKTQTFQYTYGAKILPELRTVEPADLVSKVKAGETVNSFQNGKDDNDTNVAVYVDCSNFANYIYYLASGGSIDIPGTTAGIEDNPQFEIIGKGKEVLQAIKEAIPGDLLLFRSVSSGHVSIYIGEDECCEAYYDSPKKEEQVSQNKLKNKSDFVGIYRHKSLSVPKLKNIQYININETLGSWVSKYQCNTNKNTINSSDNSYTKDATTIAKYVDPKQRMSDDLICQFMDIRTKFEPNYITEEGIMRFFKKKNRDKDMAAPSAWITASLQSGINPLFLISHSVGETAWNTSKWMNGGVNQYTGPKTGKKVYNAYGLWCYNSESDRITARTKCEEMGWFTKEAAVIGGAQYIAEKYLSAEQEAKYGMRNTPYFMKWVPGNSVTGNPGTPGEMQYASDITWADQRGKMFYDMMTCMDKGIEGGKKSLRLLIPVFAENNSGK